MPLGRKHALTEDGILEERITRQVFAELPPCDVALVSASIFGGCRRSQGEENGED